MTPTDGIAPRAKPLLELIRTTGADLGPVQAAVRPSVRAYAARLLHRKPEDPDVDELFWRAYAKFDSEKQRSTFYQDKTTKADLGLTDDETVLKVLRVWLKVVVFRLYQDDQRRLRKVITVGSTRLLSSAGGKDTGLSLFEIREHVGNLLSRLEPWERWLITQRFWEDRTYQEIATSLNETIEGSLKQPEINGLSATTAALFRPQPEDPAINHQRIQRGIELILNKLKTPHREGKQ